MTHGTVASDSGDDKGCQRLFIAVLLTDAIRAALGRAIERIRREGCDMRWVPAANLHVTMAFLGDVPPGAIPGLAAALDTAAVGHPPFAMRIAGAGFFGPPRSPRVIWAEVADGAIPLGAFYARLLPQLQANGVTMETRPFHPHVTIGRSRPGSRNVALHPALAALEKVDFGAMTVSAIHLMRSHLESAGARYVPLHASVLS